MNGFAYLRLSAANPSLKLFASHKTKNMAADKPR
jgi:hypothetical protein